jgi:alkaline phosphatase
MWAETALRIVPPQGATFVPGQRFDVRIEADDLKGQPGALSFAINGQDSLKEMFGAETFKTFTLTIRIPVAPAARGAAGTTTGAGAGAPRGGAATGARGATGPTGAVGGAAAPARGVNPTAPAAGANPTAPARGANPTAPTAGNTAGRGGAVAPRGAAPAATPATDEHGTVAPVEAGPTTTQLNGGIIRRNWTFDKPGKYELTASLVQSDGKQLTARSTIEVLALQGMTNPARNIILFIGDGMGGAERTAARIVSKGVEAGKTKGLLEMDQMETIGLVMTSSLDALVTDSSPGASAWATGNKSANNWHGVFPDNTGPVTGVAATLDRNRQAAAPFLDNPRVENIAEFLHRTRRMSTGVVSTVAVTDSTPGAFSSHAIRYAQNAIAEEYLSSGHSVILGGGARYFAPAGDPVLKNITSARPDGRNLIAEFKNSGYAFVSTATELRTSGGADKLLGLFHGADFASRYDRMRAAAGIASGREAVGQFPDQPSLELMTQQAINVLSKNPNGFFLMVEGGSIDRELHRLDPNRSINEVIELDKAIGVARAWASAPGHEDTLILVTADHETSGLVLTGVNENGRASSRAFPSYVDKDGDGFPDDFQPELALTFDFASAFNPPRDNRIYDLPKNLKDLNPTTTVTISVSPAAGHSAVDVPIGARGRGANLFNGVMDNTDIFFRMLRVLGAPRP